MSLKLKSVVLFFKILICRMSGSYFYKWLLGFEKFSGLSRNGPLVECKSGCAVGRRQENDKKLVGDELVSINLNTSQNEGAMVSVEKFVFTA